MEKIKVNTEGAGSEILVGHKWESVTELLPGKGVVIISDENIIRQYGKKFPGVPVLSIVPGEGSKKLEIIKHLAEKLLETGIDRSGFVLGIGGGVVCDLAGFLASIYMRGIRCGYVSTSLLSQVDASIGGKNGVNLGGVKNILGNIRQPEFVICDPEMLNTLPEEEYLSGLAELIKTAIIGDGVLFELIERNYPGILIRDSVLLTDLISRSVKFKAAVVSADEKENGLRRILNFGHTYGHAIEMHLAVKHGFAIASGMEIATYFSLEKGLINEENADRIINVLKRFNLTGYNDIPENQMGMLILHDKKKTGTDINFVFANGIGKSVVKKITIDELTGFYKKFRNLKKF